MTKATLKDARPRGQNVIVRTDYNVPIKDGKIVSDLRIRASLPTLEYLRKKGARRIIVLSHLGRPDGKRDKSLSLEPVAKRLGELMPGGKVSFIDDVSGPDVEEAVQKTPVGGILVMENLRFFPGEESNSADFAREIVDCTGADLFVQDGFAVIHRAHASTAAITGELPSVMGLLVEREMTVLKKTMSHPEKPFTVMIGGAKVEDKAPLIQKFLEKADRIIVGGKIAADFSDGKISRELLGGDAGMKKIYIVEDFSDETKQDIGTKSTEKILEILGAAKTVLWNGTMGLTEEKPYDAGSRRIAEFLGGHTEITSVVCGGDTTGFVESLEGDCQFSLVSTGGGASLSVLLDEELPGYESLEDI
ncbi:MAG: phosphoglycerate kinase [Candidatus Saccharibacteria bacterium]|nr:phosphoglycerate kinase [Candidatus Saccharibacteria bacterium]